MQMGKYCVGKVCKENIWESQEEIHVAGKQMMYMYFRR